MKVIINYINNPALELEEPDRVIIWDRETGKGVSVKRELILKIMNGFEKEGVKIN